MELSGLNSGIMLVGERENGERWEKMREMSNDGCNLWLLEPLRCNAVELERRAAK